LFGIFQRGEGGSVQTVATKRVPSERNWG
jgi:hypothetical protein